MWQFWQPPVDRPGRPPTVRNMTVGHYRSTASRPTKRRKPSFLLSVDRHSRPKRYREQTLYFGRLVCCFGRPTDMHNLCMSGHSSRSTASRPVCLKYCFWADFWDRKFCKKNLLTLLENPQKYVLSFYLITKLVIKISRHISNITIHFCVLQILSKIKTVFLSNLIFPQHE